MTPQPRVGPGRGFSFKRLAIVLFVVVVGAVLAMKWLEYKYMDPNAPKYDIALSAEGARVAVRKWTRDQGSRILEGPASGSLAELRAPAGQSFAGAVQYAADAPALLFATAPNGGKAPQTLWRLPLDGSAEASALFQHAMEITNVAAMRNGGVVFLGEVREQPRTSGSPNPLQKGSWRVMRWMRWVPGGTVAAIDEGDTLITPPPTLVRDKFVLLPQSAGLPTGTQREVFTLRVLQLAPETAPGSFAGLVPRTARLMPELSCDWLGETCLRVLSYESSTGDFLQYAELLRADKSCRVPDLPARLERGIVSSDGQALAFLARDNPRQKNLALIHVKLNPGACGVAGTTRIELP
jgi:hypothetical protein